MKKVLLSMTKKVVEAEGAVVSEWPPTCVGILHQPKRPVKPAVK